MKINEIFDSDSYKEWQENDPHLRDIQAAPFHWIWPCYPDVLKNLKFTDQQGGIHILRGPRQVGKTTLLKKVIAELWETGICPKTLFIQGDWIEDFRELDQLLTPRLQDHKHVPDLVVIDEITFIDAWPRALKGWYDAGIGRQVHFLLTGSNAFDLMKYAELLPGRRGRGYDHEVLPMSFKDYVRAITGVFPKVTPDQIFNQYLRTGGFPNAVREYILTQKTDEAERVYLAWIRGDILKAGKSDHLLRELFSALLTTTLTPVGLDDLKSKSSFGSHNTVQEYLEVSKHAYIINEVQRISPDTWKLSARKNRKYYFRDPLILRIAQDWSGTQLTAERTLAAQCELVIAEHLTRMSKRFGYYRDKKQQEVDFVSSWWAIEVKSSRTTPESGLLSQLTGSSEKLLVSLAKESKILKQGHVQALPLWDYLLRS